MMKALKIGIVSSLVAFAPAILHAQTTNVVMVVNMALSGFKQSGDLAVPVKVTTRDILNALNGIGQFSFGRNAQLVLRSEEDQLPTFAVREKTGTNVVETDISNFLVLGEDIEVHANNNMQSYSLQIVSFDDHNGNSFSVSGVTSLRRTTIVSRGIGPLQRVSSASSQVSGSGTVGGDTVMLRGSFTAGSAKVEVD